MSTEYLHSSSIGSYYTHCIVVENWGETYLIQFDDKVIGKKQFRVVSKNDVREKQQKEVKVC